ncbi:MAG: dTMP kinase [Rhodospirillales bacterium]
MGIGKFITLEGGEGTGKSTQIALLCEALVQAGIETVRTREPGGAPGAEAIRRLLVEGDTGKWDALTEALLHTAARHEHLCRTVNPALAAGKWVVSDRFADSTLAYQGYGHGLDHGVIKKLYELVVGDFKPDLTIMLDIMVEHGLARAAGRGDEEDRYERMDLGFHERVRQGFMNIATHEPGRCVVIDADRTVEAVHAEIKAAVADRLGVCWP